jgi:MYXO-CTERM domain-containing protein
VKTFALALAAAVATLAAGAGASEGYPDAIQGDLDLAEAPSCDVCHAHASAPVGSADESFAKSLEARGLKGGGDVASLARALEKDKGVDSDGDGAEDLDELSWGGNPSVSDAPKGTAPPEIAYGCDVGGQAGASSAALIAVLGLALSTRRRRRNAGRPSRVEK